MIKIEDRIIGNRDASEVGIEAGKEKGMVEEMITKRDQDQKIGK